MRCIDLDILAGVFLHAELFEQSLLHGVGESHREKHEVGLDDFRLAGVHEVHATRCGIFFPCHFLYLYFGHFAVAAADCAGVEKPSALASLLVRRGGFQYHGPVGPRGGGIFSYRRLRHDFNLCHRFAALTVRGAHAVASRVAAADYKHMLSFGGDAFAGRNVGTGVDAVLLLEQFECEMHAFEVASLDIEVAGYA